MGKKIQLLPLLKRILNSTWTKYLLVCLLVLAPLLLPGFILTLDMVFVPDPQFPASISNTYLFDILLWLFGLILPGDILQKIILIIILTLSGVGMHLLVRQLRPLSLPNRFWIVACWTAGIFYMLNPFIYSRFMAGQWLFLLGYALLPFFVRSLIVQIAQPTLRRGIISGSIAALITCLSIHHIGIIAIAVLTCMGIPIFRHRPVILKKLAITSAYGFAVFAVISSIWWIPAITNSSNLNEVSSFNQSHHDAFATDGGTLIGKIANVVRLQGFWAESQNLFTLPQTIMPGWGILFLGLWIVVGIGAIYAWRSSRTAFGLSVGFILTGVVLAATPLLQAASKILPILSGYREPHKFAELVAFGFAVLFAFGAARIITKARGAAYWSAALVCLPLLLTPTMIGGFAGQLTPRQYPQQWHDINKQLGSNTTLFLPWHQYASFSFSGRIIATPAEKFFAAPVIASNDPEFGNISPTIPDERRQKISQLIREKPATIASQLRNLGISAVLLVKEQDYTDYSWLDTAPGFRAKTQNDRLILYSLEDIR